MGFFRYDFEPLSNDNEINSIILQQIAGLTAEIILLSETNCLIQKPWTSFLTLPGVFGGKLRY